MRSGARIAVTHHSPLTTHSQYDQPSRTDSYGQGIFGVYFGGYICTHGLSIRCHKRPAPPKIFLPRVSIRPICVKPGAKGKLAIILCCHLSLHCRRTYVNLKGGRKREIKGEGVYQLLSAYYTRHNRSALAQYSYYNINTHS
jgi:hypothetical protein